MFIHSSKSISHISALHPDAAAIHIHRRLHAGVRRIQQLPRITADAPDNLGRARTATSPDSITANCVLHPHKQRRYVESRPGRMFHADIAGPFLKSTVGGFQYLLVLVDDHSRFKFAYPIVNRKDAPTKIRQFIASFNNLANRPGSHIQCVGTLHTDGAGEFTSGKFRDELAEKTVNKSESPPEVHALNGVAERAIRSIFSQVRADLETSKAPKSFWPHAVAHAVDILNRTTCPPHNRCSCYEALTMDKPRIMSIWPWGCRAWAVRPSQMRRKTTLEPTGSMGMNLGRSVAQPGSYDLWIPGEGRVMSSSEVYFDETLFPWRSSGD